MKHFVLSMIIMLSGCESFVEQKMVLKYPHSAVYQHASARAMHCNLLFVVFVYCTLHCAVYCLLRLHWYFALHGRQQKTHSRVLTASKVANQMIISYKPLAAASQQRWGDAAAEGMNDKIDSAICLLLACW